MSTPTADTWTVAGRTFNSRLIVGTGKYKTYQENAEAAEAAGAEIVTPMEETPYGSREYVARDPEGHLWSFGSYAPEL